MASTGSLSGSTTSSLSLYGASVKGYTGLSSGLDVESLIESMTIGTRSKIAKKLQQKQTYQWQMDAYRSVSDKLVQFSKKYLDITSSNSLIRASTFAESKVELSGANSSKISVSGATSALKSFSVTGVKQLAKAESVTTQANASSQVLTSGSFNMDGDVTVADLSGKTIKIQYSNDTYTLNLQQDAALSDANGDFTADLTTREGVERAVNALLADESISGLSASLGDRIEFSLNSDNSFSLKTKNENETNIVKLDSGTALGTLGLTAGDITSSGLKGTAVDEDTLSHTEDTKAQMSGKSVTFNFNGTSKEITFTEADKSLWGNGTEGLKNYLQNKLDSAYGAGKVTVGTDSDKITFETNDSTSTFKITSSGVTGFSTGTSNRVNLNVSIGESGLNGLTDLSAFYVKAAGIDYDETKFKEDYDGNLVDMDGNHVLNLNINGKAIGQSSALDADGNEVTNFAITEKTSMKDIINAVNSSDAGVKMTYLETADRFSLVSTIGGSSGEVNLDGDSSNLATAIFGSYTKTEGQDAIMTVEYEGGVTADIKRSSNSFSLEGSTFTLKGTFGFEAKKDADGNVVKDADGNIEYEKIADTEAITFTTSVDADAITEQVKTMVEDYNAIVELVNDLAGTKPDRDYSPLTDEQKAEMTEDQIKAWEEKAKSGILFNDSLLRSLSTSLRTVFSGVADTGTLKNMGITISSDYSDHGTITFDEEKFKGALAEDADRVKDMFTKASSSTDKGGFATRLKSITDQYAKTTGSTKGSLITKAGSTYAATSISSNSLQKLMDTIDDDVESLKDRLQDEVDRYNSKFTALEQLISQMNSQSEYLSSM